MVEDALLVLLHCDRVLTFDCVRVFEMKKKINETARKTLIGSEPNVIGDIFIIHSHH